MGRMSFWCQSMIERILTELQVVTKVNPKGRLKICNGLLAVDRRNLWMPIRRFVRMDTRHAVMSRLQMIMSELESFFEHHNPGVLANPEDIDDWVFVQVRTLAPGFAIGIRHLQGTYGDDAQVCSQLDMIITRLTNIVSKCNTQILTTQDDVVDDVLPTCSAGR